MTKDSRAAAGQAEPDEVAQAARTAAPSARPGLARKVGSVPGPGTRAGSAPGRLEVVRAFVNTLDIEAATDELSSPARLLTWLRANGLMSLAASAEEATAGDVQTAVALREALRAVLRSHVQPRGKIARSAAGLSIVTGLGSDSPWPADPIADLRQLAPGLRVRFMISDDGQVTVAPARTGPEAGLARLLLVVAEAGTLGTWSRLKVCSADDCKWAFYDRSPTRNGCWCSMAVCGSRAKSRAYRRRATARQSLSGG